ncbi:MAG: class I tRNA ligase family protein [Melioribacteraceae bacterium]|nr:class I tRNA ligase family protein [Melioribacteraceae bacterium]
MILNSKIRSRWICTFGGAEHSTMHLLYARFVHKFLRDIGLVETDEPFAKLRHQGTITNNGAKMSKSKGNVVNPNSFIEEYGSDVFRMYLMFMGPYDLGGDWSDKGIVGVDRFVQKVYQLMSEHENFAKDHPSKEKYDVTELNELENIFYQKVNQSINKYTEEVEHIRFNTAVAVLMELSNELSKSLKDVRRFTNLCLGKNDSDDRTISSAFWRRVLGTYW